MGRRGGIMPPWSDEHMALLVNQNGTMSAAEIALKTGKSKDSVRGIARRRGIPLKPSTRRIELTNYEMAMVEDLIKTESIHHIAKEMGYGKSVIRDAVIKLGIYEEYLSMPRRVNRDHVKERVYPETIRSAKGNTKKNIANAKLRCAEVSGSHPIARGFLHAMNIMKTMRGE